jgi:hypothetical protein
MQTITIQDKYFEALKLFGETDELVETALRRFIVEQATERIKVLRDEVKILEELYGESFNSFQHKIETDESFARQLDKTHPLWEGDFINWKFYAEESQEWLDRFQNILIT